MNEIQIGDLVYYQDADNGAALGQVASKFEIEGVPQVKMKTGEVAIEANCLIACTADSLR